LATTTVDLKVALNMTIGGVPVMLQAELDQKADETIYTFDGSIQNAEIPLGDFLTYIGQQFEVSVLLPPEMNLKAKIDYVVGQIIYTKPKTGDPTTELGAAAKFELTAYDRTYVLKFYADSILKGQKQAANPYVVGASIETDLKFADLPLVGNISGIKDLALTELGFSYTNTKTTKETPAVNFQIPQVTASDNPLYTRSDPNAREAKIYTITSTSTPQNFALSSGGFSLTVGLVNTVTGATMANFALPMALPAAPPPAELPAPAEYYPKTTSPPATPVHWIDINKTFGPVNLKQIGLNYSQGEATFGFSAGFTVGGFALALQGLSITFPMPLPGSPAGHTVSFDLEGLAINFTSGALSIGGAFLKVLQNGVTNYYGMVSVQASKFGFKALGGYAPAHDDVAASFFLYANIQIPLGGPPFLFVTGLAGGFGINRSLILPTLDELPGYILLPYKAPKQQATAGETFATVLPVLEKVFIDQPGQYWVAVGIQFTSFEMISAFALVTVAFGVDLQIALLGSCAMTLPTGAPNPVAYVEIDIMASFTASSGLFAIQGKLSPASYLFGGFCKLQGGFAFYIWLTGDYKGEFVVTLGGYNPAYTPLDYYPLVPRLGMSFGLGPFQVVGQAYFALTPAMFMAGLTLTATWNAGPIKAWLDAGMDFLISWAPFYYQAGAYISIGCSVNLGLFTLSVNVGAGLTIWGPAFGGKAIVDLDVITFTIAFGSTAPNVLPVDWKKFKSNFLPADKTETRTNRLMAAGAFGVDPAVVSNIIKASVTEGLDDSEVTGRNGVVYDWILDPNKFEILTNSTIPANNAEWTMTSGVYKIPPTVSSYNPPVVDVSNGPYLSLPVGTKTFSPEQVWNPTVNIAPMDLVDVTSYHTITLTREGAIVTAVSAEPMLLNTTAALWAENKPEKTVDDAALVEYSLVGFLITPIQRVPDSTSAVPILQLLFAKGFKTGFKYTGPQVDKSYTVSSTVDPITHELKIEISGAHTLELKNENYILSALADLWVAGKRDTILTDLNLNGFSTYTPAQIDVGVLAKDTALVDWPMVELLGSV
jgi:hypothetical protein